MPSRDTFTTKALPLVHVFEGGYSNHPSDRGGATYKGIIQRVYDKYRKDKKLPANDVRDISEEEIADIYYTRYWIRAKCHLMPSNKIAIAVFDTAVNMGPKRAAKFLQRASGAVADGIIGPLTLEALGKTDPDLLCRDFFELREGFYRRLAKRPGQDVFLSGWLRRLSALRDYVLGVKTIEQIEAEW